MPEGAAAPDRVALGVALGEVLACPPAIASVRRRAFARTTRFECAVLSVGLVGGQRLRLFAKDYGRYRLATDDPALSGDREIGVYRDVLRTADLGTAAYYGTVTSGEHRWLLLEFLAGAGDLTTSTLDAWLEAARWLGRLHAWYVHEGSALPGAGRLPRHDARSFREFATTAVATVASLDAGLAGRLDDALRDEDGWADELAREPVTLVHGSFQRQNVLVVRGAGGLRICPVDWEHAALGSPLYDLAFLARGFRGAKLAALVGAWRRGLVAAGGRLAGGGRSFDLLDGFRLHHVARSLAAAVALGYDRAAVERFVLLAEALRERRDRRHRRARVWAVAGVG